MSDYVIHNQHTSNFANAMIKYLVAKRISEEAPSAKLSNYAIPTWGIRHDSIPDDDMLRAEFTEDMRVDLLRIKYLVGAGVKYITLHGHLQRVENLPTRDYANAQFPLAEGQGVAFGSQFLVCPVRAGEILAAEHKDYTLLPVLFYKEVFTVNPGLRPVFMGQTEPNSYTNLLRSEFPGALFLPTQGPMADFQTIRLSRKIVVPVSTFAWLAAWMSNAEMIVLPAFGLFNPQQAPDNDLIPVGDGRYQFYRFPEQRAVPLEQVAAAHEQINGSWRKVSGLDLARLRR